MENTYLDAEATLARMHTMEDQSNVIKSTIDETVNIMEQLMLDFKGASAAKLSKEYSEVAETFDDFRNYLQQKIKDMETLTGNIQRADQG